MNELPEKESIDVARSTLPIRVFCVSCERRAEVIAIGESEMLRRFLHVRCHGEELLAWLPEIAVRRMQAITRDRLNLDFVWNELDAIDTLERLEHSRQRVAEDIARCDDMLSLGQPTETDAYLKQARGERQALLNAIDSVRRNLVERGHAALVDAGVVSQDEIDKVGP